MDNLLHPLKTTSKRLIQKTVVAPSDLIDNKIAQRITKISKVSQQNNSETVKNKHDKEMLKERYTSPEERQKVIGELKII